MTTATITLDTPIKRGETEITEIALRKPAAGELRGLSVAALVQMDATATITLLPRITTPTLTPQEADRLDTADLLQICTAVVGFLLPKAAKAEALAAQAQSPYPLQ